MIYLDHAASTPLRPEVRAAMEPWLSEPGNPSSLHAAGRRARRAIEDARDRVAFRLGADPKEIVFTSGATEANHLALHGDHEHVVTTAVEHASVLEAAARHRSVRVEPDGEGRVSVAALLAALTPKTSIVSVMAVNNETGAILPVAELRRALPARVLLHSDAAQAVGRVFTPEADLVTFSAHKIGGPKGVGGLRIRRGVKIAPMLKGGAQEFERRAGTENVAGIVGLAEALDLACASLASDVVRQAALRDRLEAGLLGLGGMRNGPAERAPHLVNVSFEGVDGEAAVLALDTEGVCVSSGSACASGGTEPSHVLLAMGLSKARAKGGLRFSLSPFTTEAEIDAAVRAAGRVVERLRKR